MSERCPHGYSDPYWCPPCNAMLVGQPAAVAPAEYVTALLKEFESLMFDLRCPEGGLEYDEANSEPGRFLLKHEAVLRAALLRATEGSK